VTSEGSSSGNHDEVELKLPSRDLDAVRKRIREHGGAAVSPLHFESNDLYDDAQGRLASSGCALRLRRANNETILTFKGPARFESGVKRRREHETSVADGEEAEAILAGLGLTKRFRYEKRREEWKLEDCTIALDQTPIGDFVEIEGDPTRIRRVVSLLELDSSEAIPYSYARFYALRRQKDPSLPPDMVFPPEAKS
jgi:adenylate cyclase, class 2